jgi:(p)ppGpp synthase/HD superfamily hydrolase
VILDSRGRPDVIGPAMRLAYEAHAGQLRKNSDDPYILHPCRVAIRASLYCGPEGVAAALLHDTLEDTELSPEKIEAECGLKVLDLVLALTNPSKDPGLPRAERKAMDREHLKGAPFAVKYIKLWDRIDNLEELIRHVGDLRINAEAFPYSVYWASELREKNKFLALYCRESRLLLEVLKGTDSHAEGVMRSLIDGVIGEEG